MYICQNVKDKKVSVIKIACLKSCWNQKHPKSQSKSVVALVD